MTKLILPVESCELNACAARAHAAITEALLDLSQTENPNRCGVARHKLIFGTLVLHALADFRGTDATLEFVPHDGAPDVYLNPCRNN